MNATLKAQNAYQAGSQPIRTTRGTEYDAFARITRRLKLAVGQGPDGFGELAGAIHDNRRLWTILATDVADQANSLPSEVRARIIYLAEFTRTHSSQVLNAGASPDPLIEINTAVMSGLRDRSEAR